jgi:hypothetical protein
MNPTHVRDTVGLAELFEGLAGRTLLGAFDCSGLVELVFDHPPPGVRGNLVSIYTTNRSDALGTVVLGGVADPEAYARALRRADRDRAARREAAS